MRAAHHGWTAGAGERSSTGRMKMPLLLWLLGVPGILVLLLWVTGIIGF
jgi:hypothetical protein